MVVIWVLCHAISEVLKIGRGQTKGQCLGKIHLVQTQHLIGQKASLDAAINYSNIGCAKLSIPGAAFLSQRKILAHKMYTISVGWLELVWLEVRNPHQQHVSLVRNENGLSTNGLPKLYFKSLFMSLAGDCICNHYTSNKPDEYDVDNWFCYQ